MESERFVIVELRDGDGGGKGDEFVVDRIVRMISRRNRR